MWPAGRPGSPEAPLCCRSLLGPSAVHAGTGAGCSSTSQLKVIWLLPVSTQPGSRKQFLSPEQASQPPGLQQSPLHMGSCVRTSGQRENCRGAVRLGDPSHQTPSPGRSGSPQTTANHPESRAFCKPGGQGCLRVGLPLPPPALCTSAAPPQPHACPHPALPDALGLNSARARGTQFLSPAGHAVRPFVPEGGPLGGRAHCPLASPPPASKEITQALIRSPRDRRKLECPRCLIAPAPAAATGTLRGPRNGPHSAPLAAPP